MKLQNLESEIALRMAHFDSHLPSTISPKLAYCGQLLIETIGCTLPSLSSEGLKLEIPREALGLPWELLPIGESPICLAYPVQRIVDSVEFERTPSLPQERVRILHIQTQDPFPILDGLGREHSTLTSISNYNNNLVLKEWFPDEGLSSLENKVNWCDIIHISGHAESGAFQISGNPLQWLEFEKIFPESMPFPPKLVWLNVCGEGQGVVLQLLKAGCRNVLSYNCKLLDVHGENMVSGFYRRIASGSKISDASFWIRRCLADQEDHSFIHCHTYGEGEALLNTSIS